MKVVCFGYVNPGEVFSVDKYPSANTGAYVTDKRVFIGADCAMVAILLARWGFDSHLIGNALGDDVLGRDTVSQLNAQGVKTHIHLRSDIRTPHEIDISDRAGTRTFFVESNDTVWSSLIDADLSAIDDAQMLYVDWYVGEAAAQAMRRAKANDVLVYLNVEYSLNAPEKYRELIALADVVQVPMSDVRPLQEDAHALARAVKRLGAASVFVTRGKYGSMTMIDERTIVTPAPEVRVIDTHGAGAVFSAVAMRGLLEQWDIERVAQSATEIASFKCERHGLPD
jgi:ribokinase